MSSHGLGNNVVASNVASFLCHQGDVLRFAAVCKLWRNTLKSSPMHRFTNLVMVKKMMPRSCRSLMFHSCGDILELFSDFMLRCCTISPLQFRYLFKHARKIKLNGANITPWLHIPQNSNLEKLHLQNCGVTSKGLEIISKRLVNLKSLSIKYDEIDEKGVELIASGSFNKLERLLLYQNNINQDGLNSILSSNHMTNIKKLLIGKQLAKSFPKIDTTKFPILTHLGIQDIEMDQIGFSNILKSGLKLKKLELRVAMSEMCSLIEIHLIPTLENVIIQFDCRNLWLDLQYLSKMNLKKLELLSPPMTTNSLTSLCYGDNQLKEIILCRTAIVISDLAYYCSTSTSYCLTSLNMTQCNLTGYHLKEIAKLTNLKYLNLDSNKTLQTNDLLHLGSLLKLEKLEMNYIETGNGTTEALSKNSNPRLHTLSLYTNGIQDCDMQFFNGNFPILTDLGLSGNKLTDEGLKTLASSNIRNSLKSLSISGMTFTPNTIIFALENLKELKFLQVTLPDLTRPKKKKIKSFNKFINHW